MTDAMQDDGAFEPMMVFDETDMPVWSFDSLKVPNQSEWKGDIGHYLGALRLAGLTLGKTKPELLQLVSNMNTVSGDDAESDVLVETLEQLQFVRDRFEAWATAIGVAQSRLMAAACKLEADELAGMMQPAPTAQH